MISWCENLLYLVIEFEKIKVTSFEDKYAPLRLTKYKDFFVKYMEQIVLVENIIAISKPRTVTLD